MASESARFYFDSLEAAAAGLLMVVLDARTTERSYRFGGLTAVAVLNAGLLVEGDIEEIRLKLSNLPGVVQDSR